MMSKSGKKQKSFYQGIYKNRVKNNRFFLFPYAYVVGKFGKKYWYFKFSLISWFFLISHDKRVGNAKKNLSFLPYLYTYPMRSSSRLTIYLISASPTKDWSKMQSKLNLAQIHSIHENHLWLKVLYCYLYQLWRNNLKHKKWYTKNYVYRQYITYVTIFSLQKI